MKEKWIHEQIQPKESDSIANDPKPHQVQQNSIIPQRLHSSMLGNGMRNNVELVVTSQELVVEGEPLMLDKDQTENLQVESQSMGKDGSKV